MSFLKNPLIFALDIDDKEQALHRAHQMAPYVGAIKLGPRLIYRYGADFVRQISHQVPVFVDNKYFDIPSTMVSAVQASFDAGATLVTVHALAGAEALKKLAELEHNLNQVRPFKILAVTVLTSWDQSSMPANLQSWPVSRHVRALAEIAQSAGLTGLVCSGHELDLIKDLNLFKVTPGIRLENAQTHPSKGEESSKFSAGGDDQKRVMTPQQALSAGASALVIGRPLLEAADPVGTVQHILAGLQI